MSLNKSGDYCPRCSEWFRTFVLMQAHVADVHKVVIARAFGHTS